MRELLLVNTPETNEILEDTDIPYSSFGTRHYILRTTEQKEYSEWRTLFEDVLHFEDHIQIEYTTGIHELPVCIRIINTSLIAIGSNLQSLNNLEYVHEHLVLPEKNLVELPENLWVGGDIWIHNSHRDKVAIPEHLWPKVRYYTIDEHNHDNMIESYIT